MENQEKEIIKDVKQLVIEGNNNTIHCYTRFELNQLALDTFWKRLKWLLFGKIGIKIDKDNN